jgi:hypothetical protein
MWHGAIGAVWSNRDQLVTGECQSVAPRKRIGKMAKKIIQMAKKIIHGFRAFFFTCRKVHGGGSNCCFSAYPLDRSSRTRQAPTRAWNMVVCGGGGWGVFDWTAVLDPICRSRMTDDSYNTIRRSNRCYWGRVRSRMTEISYSMAYRSNSYYRGRTLLKKLALL